MSDLSSRLHTVLDRLPFSVDDTEAANEAFRRWQEEKDPSAQRLVDLWTYCYVCRYFLAKSHGDAFESASAPDELITRTYEKIQENRDGVRDPDRYTNWVSVVCKNTFLNYTRRERVTDSINEEKGPILRADESGIPEKGFVRKAFAEAIDRLPEYLQEPARLYFLEHREVEEISESIGEPVPTVLTYKHKATKKLRNDKRLQKYVSKPKRPARKGGVSNNKLRRMMRAIHVTRKNDNWRVMKSGKNSIDKIFESRREAMRYAKSLKEEFNSKIVIHSRRDKDII